MLFDNMSLLQIFIFLSFFRYTLSQHAATAARFRPRQCYSYVCVYQYGVKRLTCCTLPDFLFYDFQKLSSSKTNCKNILFMIVIRQRDIKECNFKLVCSVFRQQDGSWTVYPLMTNGSRLSDLKVASWMRPSEMLSTDSYYFLSIDNQLKAP